MTYSELALLLNRLCIISVAKSSGTSIGVEKLILSQPVPVTGENRYSGDLSASGFFAASSFSLRCYLSSLAKNSSYELLAIAELNYDLAEMMGF